MRPNKFIDYETARYSGFVDFRKALASSSALSGNVSSYRRLSTQVERLSGFQSFDQLMKADAGDHWLLSIADQHVHTIAEAVSSLLGWLSAQAGAVVAAMSAGPTAAAQAVGDPPAGDVVDALAQPFQEAGKQQISEIKDGSNKRIDFTFDIRNKKVTDFLSTYAMGLIQQITDDQRQFIHDIVTEGAKTGASTDTMARQIRDNLGLTAAQGQMVENYRQELTDGAPEALDRQLRDKRFDSRVQRAVDGDPLDAEDIDRMTAAYARRWLAYRSQTVARTEGLRSATYGSFASMAAMLDEPDMQGMTVSKKWVATVDKATRDEHKQMSGVTVIGLETPFELPDCEMLVPHDSASNIPGSETINCRCCVSYRVVKEPNN